MKTTRKILVAGATGFVGRALVLRLRRDGHEVVAWVRSTAKAASKLGSEATLLSMSAEPAEAAEVLQGVDAVVNLAGEGLFNGRWTKRRKRALLDSRTETTRRLVDLFRLLDCPPKVLISASGVGFYGDRAGELIDEETDAGSGFLTRLTQEWERAAQSAAELGTRVVTLRIGTVLGPEGGALTRMTPFFRWGLGARLGSGRQHFSWIHLSDLLEVIVAAIRDDRYQGPINTTAPAGTTNANFTRALSGVFNSRALLSVPGWALRLLLGQAASVVLASQRVHPAKLERLGFCHRFAAIEDALADVFDARRAPSMLAADEIEGSTLPRRPRYVLRQTTLLDAPIEQVFDFFSRAQNLALMTPGWMDFQIQGDVPEVPQEGATIDYTIKIGPLPLKWRTRFLAWEHQKRFIDLQERGPYALWHHEHRFIPDGRRTRMEDVVCYTLPFGPIGRLVHRLVVASQLRRIFSFRAATIAVRFDTPGGQKTGPGQLA